jgi:hypothetical protein
VVAASPAFSVPSTKTELLLDEGVRALIMELIECLRSYVRISVLAHVGRT